jgi:hypothetical protein
VTKRPPDRATESLWSRDPLAAAEIEAAAALRGQATVPRAAPQSLLKTPAGQSIATRFLPQPSVDPRIPPGIQLSYDQLRDVLAQVRERTLGQRQPPLEWERLHTMKVGLTGRLEGYMANYGGNQGKFRYHLHRESSRIARTRLGHVTLVVDVATTQAPVMRLSTKNVDATLGAALAALYEGVQIQLFGPKVTALAEQQQLHASLARPPRATRAAPRQRRPVDHDLGF